jgi:hypothetical protein
MLIPGRWYPANYLAVKLIFVHSFIAIKPDGVQVCSMDYRSGLRIIADYCSVD